MQIEFNGLQNVHQCTSFRQGDTIVWKCPFCIGYERRLNLVTGEMFVIGKTDYQHTGFSDKKENLEALTLNLNEQ